MGHQHHVEEEIFFPNVVYLSGKPGTMDASVEQHQEFRDDLENFRSYILEIGPVIVAGSDSSKSSTLLARYVSNISTMTFRTLLSLRHLTWRVFMLVQEG